MNKTEYYQRTILVPVYNEEENMARLEKELGNFLKQSKVSTCILFVNDGSGDESGELIQNICKHNSDFFYISLASNGGLSAAIKAGIDQTESEYVSCFDADLQTNPQDFNSLLDYIRDYEMVMGIRIDRKDSFIKTYRPR